MAGASSTEVSPQAKAEAKERFNRAVTFFEERDYPSALAEFERVYELMHHYVYLNNIGQLNLQLGRFAKAREALERYLSEGGTNIPADRQAQVQETLESLRLKTAYVRVETSAPSADVLVDDVLVGQVPLAKPILVNVGEHYVQLRNGAQRSEALRVSLVGNENRTVRLNLDTPTVGATPAPPQKSFSAASPTKTTPTWVYAGWIGVATLGVTAGVTGALALSNAYDSRDATSTDAHDDAARVSRNYGIATDILGGAALVGAGTMLYFTLRPGGSRPTSSTQAAFRGQQVFLIHHF